MIIFTLVIKQKDYLNKIVKDFDAKAGKAFEMLKSAIAKTHGLKTERLIRCMIFWRKEI